MILDFGCGCGRNIRSVKQMLPSSTLFGCDIDEEAITWLRQNYKPVGEFYANSHHPPTQYSDNMFDLIYSIYIFTHLPEDMQFVWLEELRRITRPGGYLFLSLHGAKHYSHLNPAEIRIMKEKGFYYKNFGLTDGLPEFYQTAFHAHEYIRREWSSYFDVIAISTLGLDNNHDTVLLQKR
jgi:ubiquinone/menaquinone biosynthesis C-methylase UbiE